MNLDLPDRDILKGHPLLQRRWPILVRRLLVDGLPVMANEIYRAETRQQWLYAQGRTPQTCKARGIDPTWARPGRIVTNAWSAKTSAHGYSEDGTPMAAALDVVPIGPDGKPWTADDRWDDFVSTMARYGAQVGLVHFHAPGKAVWDRPHLQLVEWNDTTHTVEL